MSTNRPAPIRTDGSNEFAYFTMRVRMPNVLQEVIETNPDYPQLVRQELEYLSYELQTSAEIPMLDLFPTPPIDFYEWAIAYNNRLSPDNPLLRPHWLETDWFFAETFFYRHIIQITRWWETRRDPFFYSKEKELRSQTLWDLLDAALALEGGVIDRLPTLLKYALWGNRIDLSYAAAAKQGVEANDEDIVVNDSEAAVEAMIAAQLMYFPSSDRGIAHIIADNAGTELAMDLVLADALLTGTSDVVVLHLKMHPTFVSDAIPADVLRFIGMLENGDHGEQAELLGTRLRVAFEEQRLRLAPHLFWNSSNYLWDMPRGLRRVFETGQFVVLKGDANYRRAVGDTEWPAKSTFGEVLEYFPVPLIALRTLKSNALAGIPGEVQALRDNDGPSWRIDGRAGVIQLHKPETRPQPTNDF